MKQFFAQFWVSVCSTGLVVLVLKLVDRDYDGDRMPIALTLAGAVLLYLLVAAYRRRRTRRWNSR